MEASSGEEIGNQSGYPVAVANAQPQPTQAAIITEDGVSYPDDDSNSQQTVATIVNPEQRTASLDTICGCWNKWQQCEFASPIWTS